MQHSAWLLILVGLIIVGIGTVWLLSPSLPWLGKLPGDIRIDEQQRQQDGEGDRLLLRSHEATEQLAISPATLQRLTRSGDIPCVRIGSSVRYSTDALRDWIRQKELSGDDDQQVTAVKKASRSIEPKSIVFEKEVKNKPAKKKAEPKGTRGGKKKRRAGHVATNSLTGN